MALTNGMIVKSNSGPKVYLIENGKKRWIPDPPTLMTLGGWAAVQIVDDSALNAMPEGDPYPAAQNVTALINGMVVKSNSGPKVYLIENGKKRWIPDPPTLMTLGGWAAVQIVDDEALNAMPEGDQYPSVQNNPTISESVHTNLGAGHFMDTDATLSRTGHIDATTRTRTVTWLGGFTGGVSILLSDLNGVTIGQSASHTFGVDGTITGRADRTEHWVENIDSTIAARTTDLTILHFWSPKWGAINNIVKHAVEVGKTLQPLLGELKAAGVIP